MNLTLRALRHRNFALFLSGQICALIGYWIQQIALSWLVYRLTGSATLLGVLAFASNLPVLLLAPFAGLWSDRFNLHRMMLATQALEMLQAAALTALAFSGAIEIWHIIALTMLLGMCVAVELPVRHAYLIELVGDRQDLLNAVAVMSLTANCGRLAGPVLAGLLIGWFSEATCFLINALTYIAVLASFAFIRVKPQQRAESHPPMLRGLKEGLVYAWSTVPIRFLLALLAVVALTAAPYGTLMPAIVYEAFAGNAETLGFLVGAAGMGAVCGTLLLASRRTVRGLVRFIVAAALVAGCALVALSWSRLLVLSLALMGVIGFGILVISVSVNMILQTIVDDDKRGRVMSFYTTAFLGVVPFGGLIAGMFADHIGATNTVLAGGIVCVLAALYMARHLPLIRSHIRPIYMRLGIISD
ncbi:MAG: MFS transporter [Betaproteobacteria bacterium]|nr:MFS transporter [Betaproteobacteria bacterium]